MAKLILRVPTKDAKAGSEIDVDSETAKSLITNGTARPAPKAAPKSEKD